MLIYRRLPNWEAILVIFTSNVNEVLSYLRTFVLTPSFLIKLFILVTVLYLTTTIVKILLQYESICYFLLLCLLYAIVSEPLTIMNSFPIYRYSLLVGQAGKEASLVSKLSKDMKQINISNIDNNSTIPLFILVLGESASRLHMSLYGYHLNTTPYLNKRMNDSQLFPYTDVISPHSHTNAVLRVLFNFYRYGSRKNWYEYVNLFDILNTAGYKTFWLSNQEIRSFWSNHVLVISGKCTVRAYTSIRSYKEKAEPDAALLPLLDKALHDSSRKSFIVVHLMGSHAYYPDRYPKTFSQFTSKDEYGVKSRHKTIKAYYDNSILYTDYILNEIFQHVENRSAIVLYLSDHAEDVYDDPNHLQVGHSEIPGSPYMIQIPMMFWLSTLFKQQYPELTRRIANSVNRPYMTDDLIHTILDILAIKTPDYNSTLSVISTDFNASRKRIYAKKLFMINESGVGVLM